MHIHKHRPIYSLEIINHGESAHESKPPSKISHGFNRAHGLKSCLPLNASECNRDWKRVLRQSAPATECMTLTLSWNEGKKKGLMIAAVQGKDFHAKAFGGCSDVMGTLVSFVVQAKPTKHVWWHNKLRLGWMAISKGAVKEMLNKYFLHTWIYMQFCSFQLYTTVKIKFIHGKDSVTLPKKSFQSLHNDKGLFNNMQKYATDLWHVSFLIFNHKCKVVVLQKKSIQSLGIV